MDVSSPALRRRLVLLLAAVLLLALVGMLLQRRGDAQPPPVPTITSAPAKQTADRRAAFAFVGSGRLECALDSVHFDGCTSPVDYGLLPPGSHTFLVRAVGRGATSTSAVHHWTIVPRPGGTPQQGRPSTGDADAAAGDETTFAIRGDLAAPLAPGRGGPLRLVLENPHGYPIVVTSVEVAVRSGSSRDDCDGRRELSVRQSNLAAGPASVPVPAHAAVTLPEGEVTAPFVRMRDRSANQDGCKGARFTLVYSGRARRRDG